MKASAKKFNMWKTLQAAQEINQVKKVYDSGWQFKLPLFILMGSK